MYHHRIPKRGNYCLVWTSASSPYPDRKQESREILSKLADPLCILWLRPAVWPTILVDFEIRPNFNLLKQNSFNACGVPINFANCRPLTQHVKLLVPATSTTCTSLPSRRRPSTICLFLTFQRQFRRMSGGKTAVTLLRLTTIISTLCTALTFTP